MAKLMVIGTVVMALVLGACSVEPDQDSSATTALADSQTFIEDQVDGECQAEESTVPTSDMSESVVPSQDVEVITQPTDSLTFSDQDAEPVEVATTSTQPTDSLTFSDQDAEPVEVATTSTQSTESSSSTVQHAVAEPDEDATILPEPGDGLEHPKSPNTTKVVPPPRD